MAYDGILMAALTHELKERLVGGRVDKIHQPEQDALIIHIKSYKEKLMLYISANSNLPHMTIIEDKMDNPLRHPCSACSFASTSPADGLSMSSSTGLNGLS